MQHLVDVLGVTGAVVVVVAIVWVIAHARGLRRHRIDLHIYRHEAGEEEPDD